MSTMSPHEMLNKIRDKAKLGNSDEKSFAIKLNKPGKIKFQLLALDADNLFKPRTQHFIQTLPGNDNPNEKVMVVDCQGENCPICAAAEAFKNSGVTVEAINEAYKVKYPYKKLRNFLTQPEHFLLAVRVLADEADDGSYLPKDAEIGSTQIIQLSWTALNNLMSAYEDYLDNISDTVDDINSVPPPLFGIFDGNDTVKSLTVSLRIQVQGSWSYIFSFGKSTETSIKDVDKAKLDKITSTQVPTEDYLNKAIKRIKDIQNYFVGGVDTSVLYPNKEASSTVSVPIDNNSDRISASEKIDDILGDDFDLDSMTL